MSTDTLKTISKKYCPRFGQTAVKMKFITVPQLQEALHRQVEENLSGKGHRLLGTILFDRGWMTSEQIEIVLNLLLKEMRQDEVKRGKPKHSP